MHTGNISCNFYLTLKWDLIGFYIHLLDLGCSCHKKNVGRDVHICPKLVDRFFRDSFGIYEVDEDVQTERQVEEDHCIPCQPRLLL